jgi:hypothetical protein
MIPNLNPNNRASGCLFIFRIHCSSQYRSAPQVVRIKVISTFQQRLNSP